MSNAGKKSTQRRDEDDEVHQLLQAAHDDLLLKLSVNSHIARCSSSSSSSMDPDLERRFQALKSMPTNPRPSTATRTLDNDRGSVKVNKNDNTGGFEEDDLFARFAALKNSIPSHNRKNDVGSTDIVSKRQEEESDDEEDEVEKVIEWAIDAARLDPSPPSDDESSEEEETDDDDRMKGGKKGKRK